MSSVATYLHSLASLRQNAAEPQRDAYTVAIGQLYGHRLITQEQWRAALDGDLDSLRAFHQERPPEPEFFSGSWESLPAAGLSEHEVIWARRSIERVLASENVTVAWRAALEPLLARLASVPNQTP